MSSIVKSLEKNIESNNLEKLVETMTTFEKQFENLDLQTSVMDDVMGKQVCCNEQCRFIHDRSVSIELIQRTIIINKCNFNAMS